MNTTAPSTGVLKAKRECYFEAPLTSIKEIVAVGHPARLWSSTDPRWKEIEKSGKDVRGSLIVATLKRDGDEILPNSSKVESLHQLPWGMALEWMQRFEKEGRIETTNHRDEVARIENSQTAGAEVIAKAVSSGLADALKGAIK
jgi:hypothetical protein